MYSDYIVLVFVADDEPSDSERLQLLSQNSESNENGWWCEYSTFYHIYCICLFKLDVGNHWYETEQQELHLLLSPKVKTM